MEPENGARATDGKGGVQSYPVPRVETLEDISGAALLLAFDASAYITGHILIVEGGQLLAGPGGKNSCMINHKQDLTEEQSEGLFAPQLVSMINIAQEEGLAALTNPAYLFYKKFTLLVVIQLAVSGPCPLPRLFQTKIGKKA